MSLIVRTIQGKRKEKTQIDGHGMSVIETTDRSDFETIPLVLFPKCSRSRVEGDKRTERSEIEHEPCHCQKQLNGGDHGSGVEVSGSAVSVPPGGVSGYRAANRGTHFSHPHLQGAVGR
jgi:hypothetical protein